MDDIQENCFWCHNLGIGQRLVYTVTPKPKDVDPSQSRECVGPFIVEYVRKDYHNYCKCCPECGRKLK